MRQYAEQKAAVADALAARGASIVLAGGPTDREALEAQLRADEMLDFHVDMILHGREVFRAARPRCRGCVPSAMCDSAFKFEAQK